MIELRTTSLDLNTDIKNNFHFIIETDYPINFSLKDGENMLSLNKYAAPGDSLWLDFYKNITNVSGNCDDCISFMFEWESKFHEEKNINKEFNTSYARLESKEFAAYWKQRRAAQLNFLNLYFTDRIAPKNFIRYMTDEINYDYATAMLQYSWRKESAKYILNDTGYLKFLDAFPVNNKDALSNLKYIRFLRELPYSLFVSEANTNSIYSYRNEIHVRDSIAKIYFTGKVYDLALYQILYEQIGLLESLKDKANYDFEKYYLATDSIYNLYKSAFNNQNYYDRLRSRFSRIKFPNRPAPDFTLRDVNGKLVSLSGFKGKVIYLEFWSPNSNRCVADIPEALKLQERFKDKNIVFLYLAMDNSNESLARFIQSRSFTGIHLPVPKEFGSELAENYEITAVPHYFLIDKNGLIVNENAPAPGSDTGALIEKLLQQ